MLLNVSLSESGDDAILILTPDASLHNYNSITVFCFSQWMPVCLQISMIQESPSSSHHLRTFSCSNIQYHANTKLSNV